VKVKPTIRCSMSNAWVAAPGRTRTTLVMSAASGVSTPKDAP
jgi:hypothetical protein